MRVGVGVSVTGKMLPVMPQPPCLGSPRANGSAMSMTACAEVAKARSPITGLAGV